MKRSAQDNTRNVQREADGGTSWGQGATVFLTSYNLLPKKRCLIGMSAHEHISLAVLNAVLHHAVRSAH